MLDMVSINKCTNQKYKPQLPFEESGLVIGRLILGGDLGVKKTYLRFEEADLLVGGPISINLLKFIGSLAPLSSPLVLSHSYSEQVKESSSLSSALELLVVVLLRPKIKNQKIWKNIFLVPTRPCAGNCPNLISILFFLSTWITSNFATPTLIGK